jgi:hypothetical protein
MDERHPGICRKPFDLVHPHITAGYKQIAFILPHPLWAMVDSRYWKDPPIPPNSEEYGLGVGAAEGGAWELAKNLGYMAFSEECSPGLITLRR